MSTPITMNCKNILTIPFSMVLLVTLPMDEMDEQLKVAVSEVISGLTFHNKSDT
jgi:hypothetical protein